MKKLIIEVRVNEYAMRDGNPHVPWSAEEIGRDAAAIREAGASIIHFHARGADGAPAHATADYAAAIRAIRRASDLIVHPTLGQITVAGRDERIEHIVELARDPALKPEIAAIDTGSANIDRYDTRTRTFQTSNKVYVNSHETLVRFCTRFAEIGVRPVISAWNGPFLRTGQALIEMGLISEPAYALLVHCEGGLLGGHPATSSGLQSFLSHLPRNRRIEWTVCAKFGNLFPVAMQAIAEGGHVAIGIGDYDYPELGRPTNADLVREIVRMARLVGREAATPAEARQMLAL
ncbi:MAG: 3-keto-5-aminohexanoate cleavage protein [Hyphomicrobiaceae bacterium]|nr:3-keto-5-aminohexanoate cleavage protein [Hyphomicrobiaceae bacterium]